MQFVPATSETEQTPNPNQNKHLGLLALPVVDENILPTLISARHVPASIQNQIHVLQSVERSVAPNITTYHAIQGVDSSVRQTELPFKRNIRQRPGHQTLHQPQTTFSTRQDMFETYGYGPGKAATEQSNMVLETSGLSLSQFSESL